MNSTTHYDAIIIGSGQAGGPLATALANAGWHTALIERIHVGGTCVNEGCTPTKTMVASGRVTYLARRGADYGVHTDTISVDMPTVRQRKRAIVESFRTANQRRLEHTAGVDLLFGEARFIDAHNLEVHAHDGNVSHVMANTIFINAGARPARPDIPGIENVSTLNSTSIMELDQVPEHLLIVGGGYIGLEFGQMFRRFGSQVTVIQRGKNLLAREDEDVADAVAKIMREDGLEILLETKPVRVEQSATGAITLTVQTQSEERILTGSHLLMAAGRVPNTDWLNLAAAGIMTDKRGFIQVNDQLETNVPGIYALGDIKSGPAFTHISYDDFRIIRTNLLNRGKASIHERLLPYTVFIDPQLGRIGLSETEARAKGRNIKVARMPMNYVARALEMDESRGFMKVVVDAATDQILGAAILGIEGGEIMAMLEVAMIGKVPASTLRDAIFAHPTLAESLNSVFTTFDA
ncbi:mercuric reductase [Dictyobacter formicarum]|uniref:Mercuric reductase n=1 Tax=Dictyobacter formicarum TaxID=2778368 RepID=A0ABQ3VVK1_9CHLR|nr:mercuric reductase [Dictyobacter formicarum]GHO89820.1 mercuric reductase [Dictyobacter formicarum]